MQRVGTRKWPNSPPCSARMMSLPNPSRLSFFIHFYENLSGFPTAALLR